MDAGYATVTVAIISSSVAFLAALLSALLAFFTALFVSRWETQREITKLREEAKIKQQLDLASIVKKYSSPILLAAADLQDRLWHLTQNQAKASSPILLEQEASRQKSSLWPMTRRHYLTGTLYLFARYFAWVEILRREVQFLDFGATELTERFSKKLKDVERALAETDLQQFSTVEIKADRQIFQLQQVMIGQLLMVDNDDGLFCLSYADFMERFDDPFSTQDDFVALTDLVTRAVAGNENDFCLTRCIFLLNSLVDLIDFLDPNAKLVTPFERERVFIPRWDLEKWQIEHNASGWQGHGQY
jgi:hypothetical protein